jgi:hypothetical protein
MFWQHFFGSVLELSLTIYPDRITCRSAVCASLLEELEFEARSAFFKRVLCAL